MAVDPDPAVRDTETTRNGFREFDLSYSWTDGVRIGGWMLVPLSGVVRHGLVVLHGYGGRAEPDWDLPFPDAVMVFPCARGLGMRSLLPDVPSDAYWLAVSALLRLFPQVANRIGFLGTSFGGGIGAMAMAWDQRIQRGHLNVPSFGNHPLRLKLPMNGSGASIRHLLSSTPSILETLAWYDDATAATHVRQPLHCACALFDPTVPPAGQFAIYNALKGPRRLFVLTAGHYPYPEEHQESQPMLREVYDFFFKLI